MPELRDASPQQMRDWLAIQLSQQSNKELDALMRIAETNEQKAIVRFARKLKRLNAHEPGKRVRGAML